MRPARLCLVFGLLGCGLQMNPTIADDATDSRRAGLRDHCEMAADYSSGQGGVATIAYAGDELLCERYRDGQTSGLASDLDGAITVIWGLALAAMVDDGLLSSLDVVVSDTLTEWRTDPRKARITLRQLVNMTSGLDLAVPGERAGDTQVASDRAAQLTDIRTTADPGQRFHYDARVFSVLEIWVTRRLLEAGEWPADYLARRILRPVGLSLVPLAEEGAISASLTDGVGLTLSDWVRLGRFVLARGAWAGRQVINREALETLLEGSSANPGHGIALWLNTPGGHGAPVLGRQRAVAGQDSGFIYPPGYPELFMAAGSGTNRLYFIPPLDIVVVRRAAGPAAPRYSDIEFLTRLLTGRPDSVSEGGATPGSSHLGTIETRAVWLIGRFDTDGDMKLSRDELSEHMETLYLRFDRLDQDGDGALSVQELVRIDEPDEDGNDVSRP